MRLKRFKRGCPEAPCLSNWKSPLGKRKNLNGILMISWVEFAITKQEPTSGKTCIDTSSQLYLPKCMDVRQPWATIRVNYCQNTRMLKRPWKVQNSSTDLEFR